jgi:FKBP-type peptidyl-prolyl cis-trans isomerase FkpA
MRQLISMLLGCVLLLAACTSPYEKTINGYEYKIIAGGAAKKMVYGNFIEFHIKQMYKNGNVDTLLGDSREYSPRIASLDSSNMPPLYLKVFSNAGSGDSIVMRISTDSAVKSSSQQIPEYMHPGGYVYTTVKILNVFEKKSQADSAKRAELKINGLKIYTKQLEKFERGIQKDSAQIAIDSKTIKEWLDKHNIKYTRGKWGTFIAIHEEGTGDRIAYNDVVAVNYVAKTMDSGKIFNSTIDPKFNNLGTYEVTMSRLGAVMAGWTDALMQLRTGSKASIYIPSSLAYGKKGFPPMIKPNQNIIFDIDVVKAISEDSALAIQSENSRKAEAGGKIKN